MRPLVVCPLQFERRCVLRAGAGRSCDVACCGPGPDAVRRWARLQGTLTSRPVVLIGTAGGLAAEAPAGTAHVVTEVIDARAARTWTPPLCGNAPRCVAATAPDPIHGAARSALHADTGAAIVDMESAAFAELADERGWRWGVVRAVSDDSVHELPAAAPGLVSSTGRARPGRIALALLRRPVLAGELTRLRAHAEAGLREAVGLLAVLLEPRS